MNQDGGFASWDQQGIWLDNGQVSRYISLEGGTLKTVSLRLSGNPLNYVDAAEPEPAKILNKYSPSQTSRIISGRNPQEFTFTLDSQLLNGSNSWKIKSIEAYREQEGKGVKIQLEGHEIEVHLYYLMYPDLPLIRKKIDIVNRSSRPVKIENLEVESLNIPWGNTHNLVYQNYARYKRIGPFTGNWDDPLVALQDQSTPRGLLLGNEAPGIMKRTTANLDGHSLAVGLTRSDQVYPFRAWIDPQETWTSTWTFILLYQDRDPSAAIEGPLNDFVRYHLGIRLAEIPYKPGFVYNTWNPFRKDINEQLIMELADAAAASGIREFIIDDGWQNNRGDWEIDRKKFPNGLKPVFDHIKSKGMKPGLWLTLGTVSRDSKIYQQHPEWVIRYKDGSPISVHGETRENFTTCMTTGWKDYIRKVILGLVNEHGLEYVKLDLAVVTGAYKFDHSKSGCYAQNHPHRDREESLLMIYRETWDLFDQLHREAPDLFIDCTFETMGTLQSIDYDMCKHAEGNWLSNFEEAPPQGSWRIRQMAWWRTPVIPATALVIGNQTMDDPAWELSFQSLAGTLPIMLGDPRKIADIDRDRMKEWSLWLDQLQDRTNYRMFRQDLPGFGEPREGGWDGFARLNTETLKGGLIGIFRQGARENSRIVYLDHLEPKTIYRVKPADGNKIIARKTGKELKESGFEVKFNKAYDGSLFSVEPE
jgi:alpha-galactosidase